MYRHRRHGLDPVEVDAGKEFLGSETNNYAEHMGLMRGLERMRGFLVPDDPDSDSEMMRCELPEATTSKATLEVYGDSKLVIHQVQGKWQTRHPGLKPMCHRSAELVEHLIAAGVHVTFQHVPRKQNKRADQLANEAMDVGMAESSGSSGSESDSSAESESEGEETEIEALRAAAWETEVLVWEAEAEAWKERGEHGLKSQAKFWRSKKEDAEKRLKTAKLRVRWS